MKLLASQKKNFLEILIRVGFGHRQFEILTVENTVLVTLVTTTFTFIKNPEYKFSVCNTLNVEYPYQVDYAPGKESHKSSWQAKSFSSIRDLFTDWAGYLKRELEAEDVLTKLLGDVAEEGINFDEKAKEEFSKGEKTQIQARVNGLRIQIINLNVLPPEQLKLVEGKLDELTEKLDHLDKSGWRIFCVGTFVTIMVALSLSPEAGNKLWQLFLGFINNQLHLK